MASSSKKSFEEEEEVRPHVLAVDDSLVDRKLIEKLLTKSSFKVTTVENGQRALELLGLGDGHHQVNNVDSKVNLIITDYCMPGMTGYELLKRIKAISEISPGQPCVISDIAWVATSAYLRDIPVVVVSSENVPNRIKMCLEEGAEEFMLKPLKQSDVKKLRCHMMQFGQSWNSRLCLGR